MSDTQERHPSALAGTGAALSLAYAAEVSLSQHLDEQDPTPSDDDIASEGFDGGERTGGWQVTDIDSADWAMRRILTATAAKSEAARVAERQIQRIQDWLRGEMERRDSTIHWFEGRLHDYHLRVLAEDPKAKTVRLPHGTISMRVAQPDYQHDELTVDICKTLGLPVKVEEKPEWGEIKKRLVKGERDIRDGSYAAVDKDTGAVVEGVKIIEKPDNFTAKPAMPKGGDE